MARVIDPLVYDFMVKSSKNLFNAAQDGDPLLAEATLVNLRTVLDSYIHALHSEREG
jgi:hypothetical protein